MPLIDSIIQAVVWAAVMLTVAGVAILLIARGTQAALSTIAKTAGQALSQAEGSKGRSVTQRPQLVTEGRATMRIPEGSHLVRLVRRRGNDEGGDEKPLSDLASALAACGIEPSSMVDAGASTDGSMTLSFLQANQDLGAAVRKAALALGFAEDGRRDRPAFAPIDAQAILGRKATERAVANVEVLRERLGIDKELEIVSAEMATEAPGDLDGVVTMAARVVWRQSDRPLLRAAG
jgi:hypothetical protein